MLGRGRVLRIEGWGKEDEGKGARRAGESGRISLGGGVGFNVRGEKFFTLCKCLILGQVKVTQSGCE